MNADGSDQVRLTFFAGQDTKPTWSPKGDRIAFHRRIAGHLAGFHDERRWHAMSLQLTITPTPGFSGFPSWGKWSANSASTCLRGCHEDLHCSVVHPRRGARSAGGGTAATRYGRSRLLPDVRLGPRGGLRRVPCRWGWIPRYLTSARASNLRGPADGSRIAFVGDRRAAGLRLLC